MLIIVFSENIGESIIYLWVEKIREFLQERTELHVKADTTAGNSGNMYNVYNKLLCRIFLRECSKLQ